MDLSNKTYVKLSTVFGKTVAVLGIRRIICLGELIMHDLSVKILLVSQDELFALIRVERRTKTLELAETENLPVCRDWRTGIRRILRLPGDTYLYTGTSETKGPVIRATFCFNLSRNIVALQVETHCCAYYHVCDLLVSQQNTLLQVEATCCTK